MFHTSGNYNVLHGEKRNSFFYIILAEGGA